MPVGRKSAIRKHKAFRRRQSDQWCNVYLLRETPGAPPFYIGQTRLLASERLRWHVKTINKKLLLGQSLSPAQKLFNQVLARGEMPVIEVIDSAGKWDISEAVWIDRFRREGAPLLNVLSLVE